MAHCDTFEVKHMKTRDEVFELTRAAIGDNGVINGNLDQGEFEISTPITIKGSYVLNENSIIISITNRPIIIGCQRIKSVVIKALGSSETSF